MATIEKKKYATCYMNEPYKRTLVDGSVLRRFHEVMEDDQPVEKVGATTGKSYVFVKLIISWTSRGVDGEAIEGVDLSTKAKDLDESGIVSGRFWMPYQNQSTGGQTVNFILVSSQELASQETCDAVDAKISGIATQIQEDEGRLREQFAKLAPAAPEVIRSSEGLLEDVEDISF